MKNKIKSGRTNALDRPHDPWHHVREVNSLGRAIRVLGWVTGRVHHLLSFLEYMYFLTCDWEIERVVDIREQFPLLPVDRTGDIARNLGVRYPWDRKKKEPWVLTLDLLVRYRKNEGHVTFGTAIKPSTAFLKPRVLQLLDIQERFCNEDGIRFLRTTEKEIAITRALNIDFVHSTRNVAERPQYLKDAVPAAEALLYERLLNNPGSPFGDIAETVDQDVGLKEGMSIWIIRHLIATKAWLVDMDSYIDSSRPLTPRRRSEL
jgi:hypothetical protein